MNINALLCCGSGMSSGYMATRARKAAKKKGIILKIEAIAQSNIDGYLENQEIDIVLLGPHFASQLKAVSKLCEGRKTIVRLIPNDIYGTLDGEGLIDYMIEKLKEE